LFSFFLKKSPPKVVFGLFLNPVVWLNFYFEFTPFSIRFGGLKLLNLPFLLIGLILVLIIGFVENLCIKGVYFKLYIIDVDWNLFDFLEQFNPVLCFMNSWQFLCIYYFLLIFVNSTNNYLGSLYISDIPLKGKQHLNILRKLLINYLIEKAFLVRTWSGSRAEKFLFIQTATYYFSFTFIMFGCNGNSPYKSISSKNAM
jgi:hypothetical protein